MRSPENTPELRSLEESTGLPCLLGEINRVFDGRILKPDSEVEVEFAVGEDTVSILGCKACNAHCAVLYDDCGLADVKATVNDDLPGLSSCPRK